MAAEVEPVAITATCTVTGSGSINNNYGEGKQFIADVMYVGGECFFQKRLNNSHVPR